MPSLRMRAWSVVRFMPRMAAAPFGPAMRHCVCLRARRMCWRSASSRVEIEEVKEGEEVKDGKEEEGPVTAWEEAFAADLNSDSGTRSALPGVRRTARDGRVRSARMWPGQDASAWPCATSERIHA